MIRVFNSVLRRKKKKKKVEFSSCWFSFIQTDVLFICTLIQQVPMYMKCDYKVNLGSSSLDEFADAVVSVGFSEQEKILAKGHLLNQWKKDGLLSVGDIAKNVERSEPVAGSKINLEQRIRYLIRRESSNEMFSKWLKQKKDQEDADHCRETITKNLNTLMKKKELHFRAERSEWLQEEARKRRNQDKRNPVVEEQQEGPIATLRVEKSKEAYRLWLLKHQPSNPQRPSSCIRNRKEWDCSISEPEFDVDDTYYPPEKISKKKKIIIKKSSPKKSTTRRRTTNIVANS